MKKVLPILIFAILNGCVNINPSITTGLEGKPMPSFDLLLMDSTTLLNTNNIPLNAPIVLFYFNPYCPYCKAETQAIIGEIKSLARINFYFLSSFQFDPIRQYYDHYHLKKYSNITVGRDCNAYFGKYYKAIGVPYIAIYKSNKLLKKVLMGKVSTNLIKEIAFQ